MHPDCTCVVNPATLEWEKIEECVVHGIFDYKGHIAWWRWEDYEGYPPDGADPTEILNDDTGRTTILPPDAVLQWRSASGVIKAGQYVAKSDLDGRVTHCPTDRPYNAIGVAVQDSTPDGDVLVAIGVGVYPIRYVVKDIPEKPIRRPRWRWW